MKSPFQIVSSPRGRLNPVPTKSVASKGPLWLGALVALASAVVIAWASGQVPGMPSPLQNASILPIGDKIYATQLGGGNQAEARNLYRKAITELKGGNYEGSLIEFKQLESVYPGLQDFLWLHEAEAYAGQGNEWAVQKKLNALLAQHSDSPLTTLALYRIGQSQVRGREWDKARQTFEKLRAEHPNTEYAIGSLYFLGLISNSQENQQEKAIPYLREYLSLCAECKFSGEAADILNQLLPSPTADDYTVLGLAEAASGRDTALTIQHLSQGVPSKTWLALGKTLIRSSKKQAGVDTLMKGVSYAKDMDELRAAVDLILANTSERLEALQKLQGLNLAIGKDYLLWKQAELEPSKALESYRNLVTAFPKSDYAPESAWALLWPLLSSGDKAAYLTQAQQYLEKYPFARSAPKALFWMGKLQERSAPGEAKTIYHKVIQHYPSNYYAFRATGRLNALRGKQDLGWPTFSSRTNYPQGKPSINDLDILPEAEHFAIGLQGHKLRDAAQELMRIGATDDVKLLVAEAAGKLPPALQSWAEQVSGDRAKGLRILREALDAEARAAFQEGQLPKVKVSRDEWKLLYPFYFNDEIISASRKNNLDPFLVQSLMREESYFNEFAISSSNARGLMQLLPSTAKDVAGWEALSGFQTGDLFNPAVNIRLGTRYLSFLHQQFGNNSMPAVGAYNGGPGAMKRWVQNSSTFTQDPDMFVEKIPYEQSRDYIKKVFGSYWNYTRLYASSPI